MTAARTARENHEKSKRQINDRQLGERMPTKDQPPCKIMLLPLLVLATTVESYMWQETRESYTLDVKVACNDTATGSVPGIVTSDLNLTVEIYCKDNFTESVLQDNQQITFNFNVALSGNSSTQCVFDKILNSKTFSMIVRVAWSEPDTINKEMFLVTCSYDDPSQVTSNIERVGNSPNSPAEIQSHRGPQSPSAFNLTMVDVLGHEISGTVQKGRLVQLKGTSNGVGGENGLKPDGCDVVGSNGERYAILRAGCGDGIVFEKEDGFRTDGLDVVSPYFPAFNMRDTSRMKFHCNFTVCQQACNGSSCKNEVFKRAASKQSGPEVVISADSQFFQVKEENTTTQKQEDSTVPVITQRDSGQADKNDREVVNNWQTPVIILGAACLVVMLVATIVFVRRRRMTAVLSFE